MDGCGRSDCNVHNWHNALVVLNTVGAHTERIWMRDFDYRDQMTIVCFISHDGHHYHNHRKTRFLIFTDPPGID